MKRPNFLVIMSDQHSPHVMGCAGDPLAQTPHLDQLAAAGVLFPQAYCASPLCVPSRLTFLTSRFPSDIEAWGNNVALDTHEPTFAHQLALAGYETTLCGRMHFVGRDQNHGFARRLVGDVSQAMRRPPEGLFEGVWNSRSNGQTHYSLGDDAVGPGTATYEVYDRSVTHRACRAVREYAQRPETPFCLVVGMLLPHNPYVCPKDLFDHYLGVLPAPTVGGPEDEHPALKTLRVARGTDTVTLEQARRARAAYYGMVTVLDRNIGAILDTLAETPLAENTVVVYTSDHGEMNGEHGLWWKDTFYEASVGVPMIWSWPQAFRRGARAEGLASLLDIGPTLADLAGADPLPQRRGSSLAGFLQPDGDVSGWSNTTFAETYTSRQYPARMIRSGRWKLNLYHGYEDPQLFDLESDPGERNDLGRDPAHADVRRELLAQVTADWSGAAVIARAQRRAAEFAVTQAWASQQPLTESEVWEMPVGCNVRA